MLSTPPPARLLIVDDHPAVRVGLRAMLADRPDVAALAVVSTAHDALAEVERRPVDLVLLDVHLPDDNGLSVCLRLKSRADAPRVLIFSAFAGEALAISAVIAGADAVVAKDELDERLEPTVATLLRGDRALPAIDPAVLRARAARLDPGDLAILGMLIHGTLPEEVATTLGLTTDWLLARRWAMLRALEDRQRPSRVRSTNR